VEEEKTYIIFYFVSVYRLYIFTFFLICTSLVFCTLHAIGENQAQAC